MIHIQPENTASKSDEQKQFLLASLRVACCRVRLLAHEMTEVGLHLAQNRITPDDAMYWLHEIGGQRYLTLTPNDGGADGR